MLDVDESRLGSKEVEVGVSDNLRVPLGLSLSWGGADQMCPRVAINELPDDVLLEVFKFYVDCHFDDSDNKDHDAWHTLVHVCQRWRRVVFASPRRLDLQLLCTNRRPVEKRLDVWPVLPISIQVDHDRRSPRLRGVTNIIAALKQSHRVCEIFIKSVPNSLLKTFAAINKPFPELIRLDLVSNEENAPILPDSFLGGFAPCLLELELCGISFPELGKLLLSTRDLVVLSLSRISPSGYISPEAIVTSLSVLTALKSLDLGFRPRPRFEPASPHPPPPTRVVLPALTNFSFRGDIDYLEDIVSRIDTPLLANTTMSSSNRFLFPPSLHNPQGSSDRLSFATPPLRDFISRTENFGPCHRTDISFSRLRAKIEFFQRDEGR